MYQRSNEEYISNFELTSLAFADMILSEENNEKVDEEELTKTKLGPFETVRCICGENHQNGALIQCTECHCYQHTDCIEMDRSNSPYKCPFCRLTLDGIDPFRELKTWIEEKDSKIKEIHRLLTNAAQIDMKITTSAYGGSMRTPNINMLRSNLTRDMQDAIQKIRELSLT